MLLFTMTPQTLAADTTYAITFGGLLMMGHQARGESLFYYFKLDRRSSRIAVAVLQLGSNKFEIDVAINQA